jgi:serine/threonine protein kinase
MDLIFALFQAYSAAKEVTQVYENVSDWVIDIVNQWSRKASSATIERQVEKMAKATDSDIRSAADKAFRENPGRNIPEKERETLVGILNNMSRNVRYRSSFGRMDSSFLRSERLLDMLVKGIEPLRHVGEPVTPGSPWILRKHLGMGSFGEVWMGQNPNYPIPRAFKFFTNDRSGDWLRLELRNLAALLRKLRQHPNIVHFEDVQTDGKFPHLELEYMAGGSLEEWLIKDRDRRPALDSREIIRQVVEGLSAAHEQGIAHRDIKPANILLTDGPDIRVKLGDFGLAKLARSSREGGSRIASLGVVVGTSLYLPPESQQRSVRREATQDDVFALGVVWYQLEMNAIERPPYDFAERLRARGLDSHTIGLIERCLAHPDRRFVDARAVKEALTDAILSDPEPCPPGQLDVQYLAREYLATFSR